MIDITNPIYTDADRAREHLEALRWPDGPVCPHCGNSHDITKLKGKSTRPGVYKCRECRKPFSVTVGTVFERSKIPLNKWVLATHLLASSKKGMSAHQLHRMLGVTYKTAWFMAHRIRESMRDDQPKPMGGPGGTVEVDETFIGNDRSIKPKGEKKGRGYHHKYKILALVDRETGQARSIPINSLKAEHMAPIVRANVSREGSIMTDEAAYYTKLGREYASHGVVRHNSGEYGRGPIHTNTIEGFFSIFKRGMKGVYQHCAKKHLHRYLAEFDFRYNTRKVSDFSRADEALASIGGKRLTYRRIGEGAASA